MLRANRLEEWMIILIFLAGSAALFPLFLLGPNTLANIGYEPNRQPIHIMWFIFYGAVLFFTSYHLDTVYKSVRENSFLLVLAAYGIASSLWAQQSSSALLYSVLSAFGIMIGVYIGSRYSIEQIIHCVAIALAMAMVSSLLLVLLLPSHGIMQVAEPGTWDGAFRHKNQLGAMAILALLTFYVKVSTTTGIQNKTWWALIAITIVLIIGSQATTALIASGIMIFFHILRPLIRMVDILDIAITGLVMICAAMIAIPLLIIFLPEILEFVGKDITLTGRTNLWHLGFQAFLESPLFGYGFDAFWLDTSQHGGQRLRLMADWDAPHAHNSWLQLGLDLGLVGIFLFTIVYLRGASSAFRLAARSRSAAHYAALLFFVYLLIYSLGEDVFLRRHSLELILMASLIVAATKEIKEWPVGKRFRSTQVTYA